MTSIFGTDGIRGSFGTPPIDPPRSGFQVLTFDTNLGPVQVDVVDGVAFVGGTDTIAGSTATMDRVVRFAVTHCGLPRDEALLLVVRQASLNPARAMGLPGEGLIAGAAADLVALGADLTVAAVMRRGVWELEPAV